MIQCSVSGSLTEFEAAQLKRLVQDVADELQASLISEVELSQLLECISQAASQNAALMVLAWDAQFLAGYLVAREVDQNYVWECEVGVDPARRGRGVGKRLVLTSVQELAHRGVQRLRARVLATNAVSLRLFFGCGFERTLSGQLLLTLQRHIR